MAGGGARKPTKLRLLSGERRPSQINYNEPQPDSDQIQPTCPLNEVELTVWNQLVPDLVRAHMVTNTDCQALTHLCQLEANLRRCNEDLNKAPGMLTRGSTGQIVANPLIKLRMELQQQVRRLLTEFGMTPASRSRIVATPGKQKSTRGFKLDD